MKAHVRLQMLGAEMDMITSMDVFSHIEACLKNKKSCVIANHNLHSIYLYQRDTLMRRFYNEADLIEIDSMLIIAWGRLMGLSTRRKHRCTYLDYRDSLWSWVQDRGLKVYHLGGTTEAGPAAIANIRECYPNVKIAVHSGFFDMASPENDAVLADIRKKSPHILLVGMGMPRQEKWILANRNLIPPCAILPVGAAFDYEAGIINTPPRWSGQLGLEWLFRLAYEPERLASRYLVEPWFILPRMLGDIKRKIAVDPATFL